MWSCMCHKVSSMACELRIPCSSAVLLNDRAPVLHHYGIATRACAPRAARPLTRLFIVFSPPSSLWALHHFLPTLLSLGCSSFPTHPLPFPPQLARKLSDLLRNVQLPSSLSLSLSLSSTATAASSLPHRRPAAALSAAPVSLDHWLSSLSPSHSLPRSDPHKWALQLYQAAVELIAVRGGSGRRGRKGR